KKIPARGARSLAFHSPLLSVSKTPAKTGFLHFLHFFYEKGVRVLAGSPSFRLARANGRR
ncbi:MAG TPA: hypothetical protein VM680_13630, partial [Verrucomicrobiae bacterium]|nr:hypothetical protein [Verrucomicrobiae bacterium]